VTRLLLRFGPLKGERGRPISAGPTYYHVIAWKKLYIF
jgi:hypothetical protein